MLIGMVYDPFDHLEHHFTPLPSPFQGIRKIIVSAKPLLRHSFGDLMHEVLLEHVDGDWSGPGPGVDTQECLLPASVS